MNSIFRATVVLLISVLATAALTAQKKRKNEQILIPDKFQIKTVEDENGQLQWVKHKDETCIPCKSLKTTTCWHCSGLVNNKTCLECKMTKKAVCRTCAGVGYYPNPLERAPCPGCRGASALTCNIFGGEGYYKPPGGGDRFAKCECCKGVGAYACTVCKGKRYVETPKLKPSVGAAKLKDLKKAMAAIEGVDEMLKLWNPTGANTRKEIKAFNKLLKPATKYFPPLKRQQAFATLIGKKIANSNHFVAHKEMQSNCMQLLKKNTEYYVTHQKHLLTLCLARAENRKIEPEKKKK